MKVNDNEEGNTMNEIITEIEVEVRGTITISLRKEDIKKIAEQGGDYEEYISNMRYRHLSVEDLEEEDRTFNANIVRNAIANYVKENPALATNCPVFSTSSEGFLESAKIQEGLFLLSTEGILPTKIDRETLKYVCLCADNHNPKHELNYVFFDKDNMVATDTRRLMISTNNTSLDDVYIPKALCEAYCLDELSMLYIKQDDKKKREVFLRCRDGVCYHFRSTEPSNTWRYPDYTRIVPNKLLIEMDSNEFKRNLFVADKENALSAVVIGDGEFIFFDSDFIIEGIEMSFCCNSAKLPVLFYNETFKYVAMPISPREEDIEMARKHMTDKALS